jgi:hypothetical protein
MQVPCEHPRTQAIARRDGIDYVRCLECGQIFEADDLDFTGADDPVEEETDSAP